LWVYEPHYAAFDLVSEVSEFSDDIHAHSLEEKGVFDG